MTAATLVCLPTYNERETLPSILDELLRTTPVDVLVVDDNSPDGTGRVASLIAEREPRVHVLHRPHKRGLGAAYLAAFRFALEHGYRFIIAMDCDLSHQPRYVPELLRAAENHDLVIGSRYVPGGRIENWGPVRRALSRAGASYLKRLLGVSVRDLTSGFKCFRREVLEAIDLSSVPTTGHAFQIEMTYRAVRLGFRVKEIPIVFYEGERGRSKVGLDSMAEAAVKTWMMRFGR